MASGKIVDCRDGEEIEAEVAVPPDPTPIAVTPLQMRRALRVAGLKAGIESFLASAGEEAQEAWEYAVEIRRDDALVAAAAQALGKTAEELDELFRVAATMTT